MNFISKIKEFYFRKRLDYCLQQYSKYQNFLELGQSFFIHSVDYYSYIKNRNRYSKLLKKYEEKCLLFYEKLNIPKESLQ